MNSLQLEKAYDAAGALTESALKALAGHFGTPLYVYNGNSIQERFRKLKQALPGIRCEVLFAMKANYNPALLRLLHVEGAMIDAVSPGDVLMARAAGFDAKRILFTANNITDAEMREVQDAGVLFNIGSLSRLRKYGSAFPGSEICLRFNPNVVAGANVKVQTAGALTKFGILLENVTDALEIAAQHKLRIVGLHKHTGSEIARSEEFFSAVKNLLEIAVPDRFPDLRFVDFGGGFKVRYNPADAQFDLENFGAHIAGLFKDYCAKAGRDLTLYFEPGKFLVAESGHLLVQVNTLKNNSGRLIAGTNSGFPQLIRPVFYGAYHHLRNLSNPRGAIHTYDVCGNICESGDNFATQRELPEIREGDILSVDTAGAYCYAMGGVYNLRAMPAEVLVLDGSARIVRKRLSSNELVTAILAECEQ